MLSCNFFSIFDELCFLYKSSTICPIIKAHTPYNKNNYICLVHIKMLCYTLSFCSVDSRLMMTRSNPCAKRFQIIVRWADVLLPGRSGALRILRISNNEVVTSPQWVDSDSWDTKSIYWIIITWTIWDSMNMYLFNPLELHYDSSGCLWV